MLAYPCFSSLCQELEIPWLYNSSAQRQIRLLHNTAASDWQAVFSLPSSTHNADKTVLRYVSNKTCTEPTHTHQYELIFHYQSEVEASLFGTGHMPNYRAIQQHLKTMDQCACVNDEPGDEV